MSRFTKISFDDDFTAPNDFPPTIDEAIEMDDVENDEDFEEDEEDDDDNNNEDGENEQNIYNNEINEDISGYEDVEENLGTIEVDEENGVLHFVRDARREFCEQDLSKPWFVKIGALTLPALQDEDLLTVINPINPCSICLQRNRNVVILPCGDTDFCLCCIYENLDLRNRSLSPLICATCCEPITNILRTKNKQ